MVNEMANGKGNSAVPEIEPLDLLLKSVKRFNEWKASYTGTIEFDGANLAGARLAGADLSGVSFKDADLSGADLTGANLQSAMLYRTNASGAIMPRCKLDEAYAAESIFENADMTQVRAVATNFSRAKMQSVRFDHARLINVKFDGADLSGSRMVGALLVGSRIPDKCAKKIDYKEAVIELGKKVPVLPAVDFKWVSDDGLMFTIGRWIPRKDLSDDQVSSFVLKLRQFNRGDGEVLKGFARTISRLSRVHHLLAPCDTVCAVPASKPENAETPVTQLAHEVAQMVGMRDGTSYLLRHKGTLPSGFFNIGSNEGRHLDSIRVVHSDLIEGRTILLLDDFIDTGSTMRACRHLLQAVGAKRVLCLALAFRMHDESAE